MRATDEIVKRKQSILGSSEKVSQKQSSLGSTEMVFQKQPSHDQDQQIDQRETSQAESNQDSDDKHTSVVFKVKSPDNNRDRTRRHSIESHHSEQSSVQVTPIVNNINEIQRYEVDMRMTVDPVSVIESAKDENVRSGRTRKTIAVKTDSGKL